MSFGKRLANITHRSRWLLFSTIIEIPNSGRKLLAPVKTEDKSEDAPFDNDFFRSAQRYNDFPALEVN